jgi:hypothetical protein
MTINDLITKGATGYEMLDIIHELNSLNCGVNVNILAICEAPTEYLIKVADRSVNKAIAAGADVTNILAGVEAKLC